MKLRLLAAALLLTACAENPLVIAPTKAVPGPTVTITFQNGQTADVLLSGRNPALEYQFLQWAKQGVYNQAPVYRQLPGIFLLAGKPRLSGFAFIDGRYTENLGQQKGTRHMQAGLVTHADGTVGPELILQYGWGVRSCCEAPANVTIGRIMEGRRSLPAVQRGDYITGIAIKP
jgi:hypothetical protein